MYVPDKKKGILIGYMPLDYFIMILQATAYWSFKRFLELTEFFKHVKQ